MENRLDFADYTIDSAVAQKLSFASIEQMCFTLQKYSAACFDISYNNFKRYAEKDKLCVDPKIRCWVNLSFNEIAGSEPFSQICLRWRHKASGSLSRLTDAIAAAGGSRVFIAIENAWELCEADFSLYFDVARRCGVKGIIYCCNGAEDFLKLYDKLSRIIKIAPCPIEFKTKNRLGLAAAQSMSAIKAGVSRIAASVAGVHCDCPLEEVLMAAKFLWRVNIGAGEHLAGDFQRILLTLGFDIPAKKALIGSEVFAHESGIHVDGIIKETTLYEIIKPEDVGAKRKLVIGKHSGTASIRIKFKSFGIELSEDELKGLLLKVHQLAQMQKDPVSDAQLNALYQYDSAHRCLSSKGRMNYVSCKKI